MYYKGLSSEEMVHTSGAWVQPKSKAHKAILANGLGALLPQITSAHNGVAATSQPVEEDPRIREISEKQGRKDLRHDDIIRGVHGLLTALATLLGMDNGGAELIEVRDTLFPDGLQSAQKSYRAEAGQAKQLEARLTPELRARLQSIAVGPKGLKKNLAQVIDELINLGKELGELEDEKDRLTPAPDEEVKHAGAISLQARNYWVRVVNAFVANAALVELEPEADKLIFGPLRAAEKAASRRARNAAKRQAAPEEADAEKAEAEDEAAPEAAKGEAAASPAGGPEAAAPKDEPKAAEAAGASPKK